MFKNVQHVKDIILDQRKTLTQSVLIFVCKLKQEQQAGWGLSGSIWTVVTEDPRKLRFPTLICLKENLCGRSS